MPSDYSSIQATAQIEKKLNEMPLKSLNDQVAFEVEIALNSEYPQVAMIGVNTGYSDV